MTTNDEILFLKDEQKSFTNGNNHAADNDNQYTNLNLNQGHKRPSLNLIQSHSKPYNDKYSDSTVADNCERKSQSWNQSSDLCSNSLSLNDKCEEVKKCWKKDDCSLKTNSNNSTLSLHIAAYENSFKDAASDSFDEKNNEGIKKEKSRNLQNFENQSLFSSTFFIQNPFEFPRQQNDKVSEPELSQFQASQRLLNPNKAKVPSMETAASQRSRRPVTKRVAFSPEPSTPQHLKKATPQSKVSSSNGKRKSDKAEKKAPVPRKSLPATLNASKPTNDVLRRSPIESSDEIVSEKPTPEVKRRRSKLKKATDTPPVSNGIKLKKLVKRKDDEPTGQISNTPKNVSSVPQPRRSGLLALKRYIPPPEEPSIPEASQDILLPSSSQNHFDKSLIEEKDIHASLIEEKDTHTSDDVDVGTSINNTSPIVTEIEKPPFKEIENDKINLMVDERNDSVSEKFEPQLREEENVVAETSNITPLIENTPTVTVNDNDGRTEESKNENIIAEKPKKTSKKVTPLKISLTKHRPSLPALPAKSPPVTIERPSFTGRTRKPPKSKEYPGHEESLPSSSNSIRKRSRIPKPTMLQISIPSTPAAPMTPIPASVAEFINLLERAGDLKVHHGGTPHNYMRPPVPSLPHSTLSPVKQELPAHLAAYLPERPHRKKSKHVSDFAPSLVSKDLKRKSSIAVEEERVRSPPVSQNEFDYSAAEPMDVTVDSEEYVVNVPENFEIENGLIFEHQIEYLSALHPHLEKSFEALENRFEDEYLLREILTHDIIDSEDATIAEEELDIERIEEPEVSNYNLTYSTLKYAKQLVKMFPERVSFEEIPEHIKTFINENDATGACLKIFYEVLQIQCCMEIAVKKHKNPIASYYVYSLQNATLLRSRIFLHFSYELIQAHEWLIRHLEEDYLASYLMILKFLQAVGTTLTNILFTSANPTDLTNVPVNEHIRDMLEEKIRDPFTRMLTHLDRKLTNHDTFLMLISPGFKLQSEMSNSVYHAHEQLFVGLTNMGCTIEKIIITDGDDFAEDFTIADSCDFAINFIKNKIIDAVKRRPNERIFIASWGVTCLFVHEAVINVDGVSGIIDLAMPVKTKYGCRGKIGDKILLTYCPTMVVSGEDSGDVPDIAEMLSNFHISTGFCVVGKADSSLIVEPSILANYGITQACISRIILNHVMDFIERVVKDTHNDIHTKKLEIDYPWIITEDLNDHVLRDDNAYGVEETFLDDEEDPSSQAKKLDVIDENPKAKEIPSEQEDIYFDSSSQIVKSVPEHVPVKIIYPQSNKPDVAENVESHITEYPQTYQNGPSSYQPNYEHPMIAHTEPETADVLQEFLDEPMEEAYDEEMEFENQMAAEAIERGHTGEQNGYE